MGGSRDRNNPLGLVGILLVMLLAPIAAVLVQAAISRSREFEADRAGAEITGRPLWLASALGQIEQAAQRIENYPADANPATAHMFIINPLHGGIVGPVRQPSQHRGTHRAAARDGGRRRRQPPMSRVVPGAETVLNRRHDTTPDFPRARRRSPSCRACCRSAGRWTRSWNS